MTGLRRAIMVVLFFLAAVVIRPLPAASDCMDNPACANSRGRGPIPPGDYKINPGIRPMFFNLEPIPPARWWQVWRRRGFELHPSSVSIGCITVVSRRGRTMRNYRDLTKLLQAEMGHNRLRVVP